MKVKKNKTKILEKQGLKEEIHAEILHESSKDSLFADESDYEPVNTKIPDPKPKKLGFKLFK